MTKRRLMLVLMMVSVVILLLGFGFGTPSLALENEEIYKAKMRAIALNTASSLLGCERYIQLFVDGSLSISDLIRFLNSYEAVAKEYLVVSLDLHVPIRFKGINNRLITLYATLIIGHQFVRVGLENKNLEKIDLAIKLMKIVGSELKEASLEFTNM